VTKNIILLTIDALRADHVSWHGYDRDTTPFLDEFSDRSTVFEAAYSASSHTREALPALLTGRYPAEAVRDGFTRGAETIPMLLPDEYATAAFHSNPYISRAYGYDEGFDTFYDDLRLGQNKLLALVQRALDKFVLNRGEYHARAEEINRRSLSWVSSLSESEPFFLWNHYMDVHGPYNPPEDYAKWSNNVSNAEAQCLYESLSGDDVPSDDDVELAKNLYDGEIRYVIAKIEEFLDELETMGMLSDTLLIITSDHGDLFGEYGEFAHPRYVYPELTHVPLVVFSPRIQPQTTDNPVSTIDILPTILDLIHQKEMDLPGTSLLPAEDLESDRCVFSTAQGEEEEPTVHRFAIFGQQRGIRLTRRFDDGAIIDTTAIRLPSGSDVEIESLDDSERAEYLTHLQKLEHHCERYSLTESSAEIEGGPDAQIEERLEALGYK
jgi:arylsulfatase